MRCLHWLAVAIACLLALAAPARAATQVDMAIALLVDASRSVTAEKFVLQRDGYVNVFSDEKLFLNFMREGRLQKVAVTLIYWSSPKKGYVAVDWTVVDSAGRAKAFAEAVKASVPFNAKLEPGAKPFDGTTAPGSALVAGVDVFKLGAAHETRLTQEAVGATLPHSSLLSKVRVPSSAQSIPRVALAGAAQSWESF